MEILDDIWGKGNTLTSLQMGCRAIVIFIIALLLIRLSGRRSFGMKTASDNIIVILLGAILSRAVVGASPFLPIVTASFIIAFSHRLLSYIKVIIKTRGNGLTVRKFCYDEGEFLLKNMHRALVSYEDILQAIRLSAEMKIFHRFRKSIWNKMGNEYY
jgi:uncharacterized membrane protein YcaP (DUF421 family)